MIHYDWDKKEPIKRVRCVHVDAKRYKVNTMLTKGKVYDVINESEEFIFIIDNSDRVAGYYKQYFEFI